MKWGHLVYASNGPVLLIRAEDERVLFGFWRGQRLREIEPRLKPGGKYEMATLEIREGVTVKPAVAARLTKEAVELNETVGDPTSDREAKGEEGRGEEEWSVGWVEPQARLRASSTRYGESRRECLMGFAALKK